MREASEAGGARRVRVMRFHASFLALVAPPLAAVLLLWLFGASPLTVPLMLSALPPAYVLGAVPAFLAGRLDGALARRGWGASARLAVAASIGGGLGLLVLAPLYLTGRIHGPDPLLAPLALALAAVAALGLALARARQAVPDPTSPPDTGAP